jgi:hypothetical protein
MPDSAEDQKWARTDVPPQGALLVATVVIFIALRLHVVAGVAPWLRVLVAGMAMAGATWVWMFFRRRRRLMRSTK